MVWGDLLFLIWLEIINLENMGWGAFCESCCIFSQVYRLAHVRQTILLDRVLTIIVVGSNYSELFVEVMFAIKIENESYPDYCNTKSLLAFSRLLELDSLCLQFVKFIDDLILWKISNDLYFIIFQNVFEEFLCSLGLFDCMLIVNNSGKVNFLESFPILCVCLLYNHTCILRCEFVIVLAHLPCELWLPFLNAHDVTFRPTTCVDKYQSLRMCYKIVHERELHRLQGVALNKLEVLIVPL